MGPQVNIAVMPQIVTQVGLNLAVLSPGATQTLAQVGGNTGTVGQSNRR
jgi:hypothetical protein